MDHQQEPALPLDHPDVPLLQLVDHFSLMRSVRQRRQLLQALGMLHGDPVLLTQFFEQVMTVTSAAKVSPTTIVREAVVLLKLSQLPLLFRRRRRDESKQQQTATTKTKKTNSEDAKKKKTAEQSLAKQGKNIIAESIYNGLNGNREHISL